LASLARVFPFDPQKQGHVDGTGCRVHTRL
jgi:hypothetical protein